MIYLLSYITIDIANNPYKGGIEIHSTAKKSSIGNITEIRINRKNANKNSWKTIHSVTVSDVSDLTFDLFDITSMSGITYEYNIDIAAGNNIIESQSFDSVMCEFEGLFVGNDDKQYIAGTNSKVDAKRNNEVSYVTTLGSRTPYRISNSAVNYSSGSASGLFLEFTEDGKKFIPDIDHTYSTSVLDFLTDGTGKILKTGEGQAWYVSIDDGAASPYNDNYIGMNSITFSWTEIGDLPEFGMVVE